MLGTKIKLVFFNNMYFLQEYFWKFVQIWENVGVGVKIWKYEIQFF